MDSAEFFESAVDSISKKNRNGDYDSALALVEKLKNSFERTGSEAPMDGDAEQLWLHRRAVCHELTGDCRRGMGDLNQSLREYEKALELMSRAWAPTDHPAMLILFKIEQLLTDKWKISRESGRGRWKTDCLLSADASKVHGSYELNELETTQQVNLKQLWENSVKRKREIEDEEVRQDTTLLGGVIRGVKSSERIVILFATLVLFLSGFQLLVSGIRHYRSLSSLRTQIESFFSPDKAGQHPVQTVRGGVFALAGQRGEIRFGQDIGRITIGGGFGKLRYFDEPDSLQEALSIALFTTFNRSVWLEQTKMGFRMPSGAILLDRRTPEYMLGSELKTVLLGWRDRPHETGGVASSKSSEDETIAGSIENGDEGDEESDFDAGNEELTYQDPFSRSRRVAAVVDLRGHSLRNWLEMNVASPLLHRGSLICFEHVKIEGVGDNIPLVGVAVGGTRAELLPIGVAGSPYLYPRENERPDLEQIARYSGVILVKQPERLKQCIAFFWLALGLFLLALGLWSPGAAARMKILFLSLSLMVFSALSLFLFNNP